MLVSPTPHRMSRIVAAVCVLVGLAAHATAQQPTPPTALPDVQKLGPQVGTRVPDFSLIDQRGQSRTLSSLMGPKGLMLVFYRSADWCPYCKTQLAELQTRTADLACASRGRLPGERHVESRHRDRDSELADGCGGARR